MATHIIDNAIYDRIADAWWSDNSFMALLRNAVNPPRFAYFAEQLALHFGAARFDQPVADGAGPPALSMLDVGCGGGLLTERFASIGCRVTGVDRSLPTLQAARDHAHAMGLDISYEAADAAALPFADEQFDVVCCCDVLEHVDDVDRVVAEIARVLKPSGVFFFDTINRTWRSKLLAIKLAQDWLRIVPRDVHVWHQFVRPNELAASLDRRGLSTQAFVGLSPTMHPRALWQLLLAYACFLLGRENYAHLGKHIKLVRSNDVSLSYMGFATRGPSGQALR